MAYKPASSVNWYSANIKVNLPNYQDYKDLENPHVRNHQTLDGLHDIVHAIFQQDIEEIESENNQKVIQLLGLSALITDYITNENLSENDQSFSNITMLDLLKDIRYKAAQYHKLYASLAKSYEKLINDLEPLEVGFKIHNAEGS